MPFFVVGLNHETASLAIRERFALDTEACQLVTRELAQSKDVAGVVVLSTCNRTEIYIESKDASAAVDWFKQRTSGTLPKQSHDCRIYCSQGADAATRAFRVASGLDSLVLGEPQILGQLKFAVKISEEQQALSTPLHRLFQDAFATAKEVRSTTAIGEASVSLAGAAVRLAQHLYGDLSKCKLLLVGVGEMTELAGRHFAAHGVRQIAVANRSETNGLRLAQVFDGNFVELSALNSSLGSFDLVVAATASSLPVIGKGMVERALKSRRGKPIFMVDLGVPRDIEPEVSELSDVYLYTVDELGKVTQQNNAKRADAAKQAEEIVRRRVNSFVRWMESRATVPLIHQLKARADHYQSEALLRARKQLLQGVDPLKVNEELARALVNKLLHHPLRAISAASPSNDEALLRAIDTLYPTGDHSVDPHSSDALGSLADGDRLEGA